MTISAPSKSGWPCNTPQTVDGVQYVADKLGVIHQLDPKPFTYNAAYIARAYCTIPVEVRERMSRLRMGVLTAATGSLFGKNLLEIGYGCGSFLEVASRCVGLRTYGFDINGLTPPVDSIVVPDPYYRCWDVVCMFDVMEHLPDLRQMEELKTKWLMLTVPYCHAQEQGPEWFATWKHRKPNEHLHHFDRKALLQFVSALGYCTVFCGSPEDVIRLPVDSLPNTLTVVAVAP